MYTTPKIALAMFIMVFVGVVRGLWDSIFLGGVPCFFSQKKWSVMGRRDPSPNLIRGARKSLVEKQQKESIT